MLKRFLLNPYKNPQIINDYYEALHEQTELHRTLSDNKKAGKKEIPDGYDPTFYKKLSANEKAMKNIRKKQEQIENDMKLSASETRNLLRELMKKEVEIAKRALDKK